MINIFLFAFLALSSNGKKLCPTQFKDASELIKFTKSRFAKNDIEGGSLCLEKMIISHNFSDNQEVLELFLRSVLWRKRNDLFKKHIRKIKDDKRVYYTLFGDYYWYNEINRRCLVTYRKLRLKFNYFDKTTLFRESVCAFNEGRKVEYNEAKKILVDQYSGTIETTTVVELDKKISIIHFGIVNQKYSASDNLDIEETEAYISGEISEKVTGLFNFKNIDRTFTDKNRSDQLLSAGITFLDDSSTVSGAYSYTIDPEFSYKWSASVGYLYELFDNFKIGPEFDYRRYISKGVTVVSPVIEYYYGNWFFRFKASNFTDAILFQNTYGNKQYSISIWVSAGSEEASRPYLSRSDSSKFLVYGAKVRLQISSFYPYLAYEKRRENSFDYHMIGLGMVFGIL